MKRDYRFEKPRAPLEAERFPTTVLDLAGADLPDGILMTIRNCRRQVTFRQYKPVEKPKTRYNYRGQVRTPKEEEAFQAKMLGQHLSRCARGVRFFMTEGKPIRRRQ